MKIEDLNLNTNIKLLNWQKVYIEKRENGEIGSLPAHRKYGKSYLFLYLHAQEELKNGQVNILKHKPEKKFISLCAWCKGTSEELSFEKLLKRLDYTISHGICETCEF